VADVSQDAYQYAKIRMSGGATATTGAAKKENKKCVLKMEDLVPALSEYGVDVNAPPYYN
jgi:hypothetical protein